MSDDWTIVQNITQDSVVGGDDDGSRDGTFLFGPSPVDHFEQTFWTKSDIRPGFQYLLTPGGVATTHVVSWLRFRIPVLPDDYLEMQYAYLKLWWHPYFIYPPGHPNRSANIGKPFPGYIQVRLYNDGKDAPIPKTRQEATSLYLQSGLIGCSTVWNDEIVQSASGDFLDSVLTVDFKECFKSLLSKPSFQYNNHILIFLDASGHSWSYTRQWRFRSWSWNKWSNQPTDTAPELALAFKYATPIPPNEIAVHVEHSLDIGHFWEEVVMSECIEHIVEILEDLSYSRVYNKEVLSTVVIDQLIAGGMNRDVTFEHQIIFGQDIAGAKLRSREVEQEINISQEFTGEINFGRMIVHQLDIDQDILVGQIKVAQPIEHELFFDQTIYIPALYNRTFLHQLNITHEVDWIPDTAKKKNLTVTLSITQELARQATYSRTVESELTITQSGLGIVPDVIPPDGEGGGGGGGGGIGVLSACERKDLAYKPQKISGTSFPAEPTLTEESTILLEYNGNTLELPAPVFSNNEEFELIRIQRKTRGGDLITYRDSTWPTKHLVKMQFEALSEEKKGEIFDFLGVSLGQQITFTDYEGQQWLGVIVNPNGEVAQYFRQCGYTAELWIQIEGEV